MQQLKVYAVFITLSILAQNCFKPENKETDFSKSKEIYLEGHACLDRSYDSVLTYIHALSDIPGNEAEYLANKLRSDYYYLVNKLDSALLYCHANFKLIPADSLNENASNYNRIGSIYNLMGIYDSSEIYFRKSIDFYKANNQKEAGAVMTNLAYCKFNTNNIHKAIELYDSAIVIAENYSDTTRLVSALANLGYLYDEIQIYDKSMDCYDKAFNYSKTIHKPLYTAVILQNLGSLMLKWDKSIQAMSYFQESMKIYNKLNDSLNVAILKLNIGAIYGETDKPDSALIFYSQAYKIFVHFNSKEDEALALSNIASCYFDKGNFAEAENYWNKSLTIRQQIEDKEGVAKCFKNLGEIELNKGRLDKAELFFHETEKLAEQLSNRLLQMDALKGLTETFEKSGRYKEGLQYFKQYKVLSDSVFNENTNKQLTNANVRYETNKRKSEIEKLKEERNFQHARLQNKNLLISLISTGSIAFTIILLLLLRQKTLRHEIIQSTTKQKMLRLQINPHFLFNSLTSIQSYTLNNSAEKSAGFMGIFAVLMRGVLESSVLETIRLEEEIQILTSYLEIQKLRCNNCFSFQIDISQEINPELISIPPMLMQPFVENAIEHGIDKIQNNGYIHLNYQIKKENLIILLTDNGKGLMQHSEGSKKHISRAIEITRERMAILKKTTGYVFEFTVTDRNSIQSDILGVQVEMIIPLINEFN